MKTTLIQLTRFLLVALWAYAACSKLSDLEHSRYLMLNQVFPKSIALILVWAVPLTEIGIAVLLCFEDGLRPGFRLSMVLLSLFTLYICLILTNIFGRIPCSCGGFIERMSWEQHLAFNLFFIFLAVLASRLLKKQEEHQELSPKERRQGSEN